MTDIFRFTPGTTPLLLSIPHCGIRVPDGIARRLTPEAARLPDTDWHLERLYDFAPGMGAGVLSAVHSRYVVDLNRDPEDAPLYAGADNTEVCPLTTFEGQPVHGPGSEPDAGEVARRIETYWRPYHRKLEEELAALVERLGIAVLFEAHSIRSRVPRFFAGRLPDLNLGTASGRSAEVGLADRLAGVLGEPAGFSHVVNGRFTGGFITRHHGRPRDGVHAVQLEMAQCVYMEESPPFAYLPGPAERLRPVLRRLVSEAIAWAGRRAPDSARTS